jgi:diacylglycerol kinase (ATP)
MYFFILNPIAGRGRSVRAMQRIKEILDEKREKYKVVETEYPGHATVIAKDAVKNGVKRIVAVGGDGTLLEVANGMIGENAVMGIIPAGTGNDFIKAVGIPNDPDTALEILLREKHKRVDIGLADEKRYFLNISGTGFDVEVLKNTEKVKRFLTGLTAYYTAVLMAVFGYRFKKVTLKMEGRTIEKKVLLVAVANGISYGGGMKVAPEASIEDGLLNVTVVEKMPRWRIPIDLPKFVKGEHETIKYIEKYKCESVTIETEKEEPLNMDGEITGSTPVTFKVVKNAISVFAP